MTKIFKKLLNLLADKEFKVLITKIIALISAIIDKKQHDLIDDRFFDLIKYYILEYKDLREGNPMYALALQALEGRIKGNDIITNSATTKIKEEMLIGIRDELITKGNDDDSKLVQNIFDIWKELRHGG